MSKTAGMTEITGELFMGWHDFYRRRDALDRAVARGELDTGDVFANEQDLLLALHHRWALRLAARVELATLEADRDPAADRVDAVGAAWRRTAEENADLRRLLDDHAHDPALRQVTMAEHRLLAHAAGLTEAGDSAEEAASIGSAFLVLQRSAPARQAPRNPVERLFRRLVPAS